jgi:hypothetical protein
MPWKTHFEPNPRKQKGKQAGTGTLTATYTDGLFSLVVVESNFEPDDESSRNDFVARAKGELAVIKGAEQKMDELLNAGEVPAA